MQRDEMQSSSGVQMREVRMEAQGCKEYGSMDTAQWVVVEVLQLMSMCCAVEESRERLGQTIQADWLQTCAVDTGLPCWGATGELFAPKTSRDGRLQRQSPAISSRWLGEL
jgi:hypothetical protein